jgi:hypothetical protein
MRMRKATVSKTNNVSPMQRQFADTYEDKRKTMFLYTARELTGRAMSREYVAKEKSFDWNKFCEYFESHYQNYSADEILSEILAHCYWLASESQVIDLYFRYQEDARKNSNNSSKQKSEAKFDFAK